MDQDPYKPPDSTDSGSHPDKPGSWWKFYFIFITLLSVLGTYELWRLPGFGNVDIIMIVLGIVATVGLFGFVFSVRISTPRFWRYFFAAYVLLTVAYEPMSSIDFSEGLTRSQYITGTAIGVAISLPGYVALYLYSIAERFPWKRVD